MPATQRALPLREPILRALREAIEAHPRRIVSVPDAQQAAVLLLVFERGGEPWIVLTKRSETVSSHKGQISFPGGKHDATDEDLWATAVRETHEELGVDPRALQQVGALDDFPTFGSGFVVSPFVAAIDPPERWNPSEHEIAEVIEAPLRALAGTGRMEQWEKEGLKLPMHVFDAGDHRVWGITAHILRRFLDIVSDVLDGQEFPMRRDDARAEKIVKDLAASNTRFDWTGIYWVEGEDLVLGPYVGAYPDGHDTIRIPEGICGAVAASGETEVVPDVHARSGHIACDLDTRSEVVVPIRLNGRIVGVLDVDSNILDAFGPEEVGAIEAAARRLCDEALRPHSPEA